MFCSNCGAKVGDDARFCGSCGSKIINNTIHKPSSSSVLKSAMNCKMCNGIMNLESEELLICPYCGYKELLVENPEISITRMKTDAYKELELEKLKTFKELEQYRTELENDTVHNYSASVLLDKITSIDKEQPYNVRFFHKEEDIAEFERKKRKRKIDLIRSYPMPDSFKGLWDYFRVVESCINVKASKHRNVAGKLFGSYDPGEKEVSDAWLDKYRKVYRKIMQSHRNDPRFNSVKEAYENKMLELKMKP